MARVPNRRPAQTVVSVPAQRDDKTPGSSGGRIIGIALWVIGLAMLVALAFIAHTHKAPWLVGMLLLRLFRQALYFVVAVASVGGIFLLLTPLVARPRPML